MEDFVKYFEKAWREGNKLAENCSALKLTEGLHLYPET